jgi:hypothetical protein
VPGLQGPKGDQGDAGPQGLPGLRPSYIYAVTGPGTIAGLAPVLWGYTKGNGITYDKATGTFTAANIGVYKFDIDLLTDDGKTSPNTAFESEFQMAGTAISSRPSDTFMECIVGGTGGQNRTCAATFIVATTAVNQTFYLANLINSPAYLATYQANGFAYGGRMTIIQIQ